MKPLGTVGLVVVAGRRQRRHRPTIPKPGKSYLRQTRMPASPPYKTTLTTITSGTP